MKTPAQVAEKLEQTFTTIAAERMRDIPILNRRLSVEVVGMREWNEYWFCVLLTPWFMNLMLLPREDCATDWDKEQVGSKHMHIFPAGKFEFIVGHESAIGRYLMCSMFSPVLEFSDQETAVTTADTVVDEMFKTSDPADIDERDVEMQKIWEGRATDDPVGAEHEDEGPDTQPQLKSDAQAARPRGVSRREILGGTRRSNERQSS